MADDKTIVLDISSDDDAGWGNDGAFDDGGVGCRDDGDWISELLGVVDKEKDDSDDVIVVDKVLVKPKLRVSKTLVKCVTNVRQDDDDDDDCVMLDGDPDKPTSVQNDRGGDDDSDDVLVVSEKGQVACRDYPHSRHLCAKYPFKSTPHEKHCDLCHCYVCDSLAPCLHWNSDHCHATDKEEFWKNMRKSAKRGNGCVPVVSSGVPEASLTVGQSPPCPIPSEFEQGYCLSNTIPFPPTQQPENLLRDQFPPQWVSRQSQNAHNNVNRGDRRHIAVNAGSQLISRNLRRRTRNHAVFAATQYCNDTSRSSYHNQLFRRNPPPGTVGGGRWVEQRGGGTPVLSAYKDSSGVNTGGIATNLLPSVSARMNLGSGTANYMPSRPQINPQAHGNSVNRNTDGPQHQISSGMFTGSNFTSPMLAESAISAEPNWLGTYDDPFSLPSQEIAENSRPSYPVSATIPSNLSSCYRSSFPAQPNVVSGLKNSSAIQLPPQVCSVAASPLNTGENVLVQGNSTQSALVSSCAGFHRSEVGNLAAPLFVGENESAAGDPYQGVMPSSPAGYDFNLDFHRSHSNQPVGVDEPVIALDSNPEVPAYNSNLSPPPADVSYDPWYFEDGPGYPELNGGFAGTALDVHLFNL